LILSSRNRQTQKGHKAGGRSPFTVFAQILTCTRNNVATSAEKPKSGEKNMDIKKILWPTDFSENAAQALPLVTSLAEKYQAEIHILYVLKDYPAVGASYGYHDPADYQKMKDWEKHFAESRLDEICEKFLNACPLYIRHISVGEPAKEILKLIENEDIDIVIMASRGSESHFDFGSVADRVIKCTDKPTLIIPV
jgi:nucleotide-binding universal stress UspA family protein